MKLYVIFGQRKENYEGQYAPEALEVINEYANDDNPTWLGDKFREIQKQEDMKSVKIVTVVINNKNLSDIMNPKNELEGEIK